MRKLKTNRVCDESQGGVEGCKKCELTKMRAEKMWECEGQHNGGCCL